MSFCVVGWVSVFTFLYFLVLHFFNKVKYFWFVFGPHEELFARKFTKRWTLGAKMTYLFWPLWYPKKGFSGFFELFNHSLVIISLKNLCLWVESQLQNSINNLKSWYIPPKFDLLWPFCEVNFDHSGVRKSHNLNFLKVILELYRKCKALLFCSLKWWLLVCFQI